MRTVGLLVLTILFPAFAHAAVIITEIMYDYPGTEGSGDHDWVEVYNNGQSAVNLGGSARFMERGNNHIISSFEGSDVVLASGATAVIANNPTQVKIDFPNIGILFDSSFSLTGTTTALGIIIDGVNVSPVTYTPIASASNLGNSLQLVGGNWISAVPTPGTYSNGSSDSGSTPSDDGTTASQSSSGAPPEYIPIPTLRIITSGNRTVSSGADTAFTAVVYDNKGNRRDGALVLWSFGDGMQRTGASVYHSYYYSGEYIVAVHASTSDGGDALVEHIITVKDASIKVTSASARGVALTNNGSRTLDLSLWRLSAGGKEFKIPAGTQILAGRTVLFPSQVIGLPVTGSALLLYPSGETAATYPETMATRSPVSPMQPSTPTASFNTVQTVEPVISAKTNIQAHEDAVIAPAAATELAAAGAVSIPSVFRSPWFFGFLGVVALAGSALIFL